MNYGIKLFPKLKICGKIKVYPEDFIVEEIGLDGKICTIGYNFFEMIKDILPKERKDYVHFTLVKRNWTTLRAISEISKKLRISRKRFGFAGTKDKRAVTAQRVSVWNIDLNALKNLKMKDILIKDFEYRNEGIKLGDLYGNKFTITIRGANTKSAKEILNVIKNGIPNFFGPQRFGVQRPINHLIGKQLLLGNFEGAVMILITSIGNEDEKTKMARKFAAENWGDWKKILKVMPKHLGVESAVLNHLVKNPKDYANALRKLPKNLRKMFIHAFQAYVFNLTLSQNKRAKRIPLIGYDTNLKGKVGNLIKKILRDEGIKKSYFKMKRMPELSEPGGWREAKMFPENFKLLKAKNGIVKIQFVLKKGCYATVLLMYLGVNVEG